MVKKLDLGEVIMSGYYRLSIVIVTYNAEKHITKCLQSIVDYGGSNLQLILVDGGSTDETMARVGAFENHIDIMISEPDQGIYDAMNKALTLLKGTWVLFLGADDRLLPTFPSFVESFADKRSIYYGNCISDFEVLGGVFTKYKLAKRNPCHQAIAYPCIVFHKYKYDLKYKVFADYLLNMQCWGDGTFKKRYLPIEVSYYNMDGYSSYTHDEDFRRDKPRLVKQYLGVLVYLRYCLKKLRERNKIDSKFF
ncbi:MULTISPECIES: glycosyltransferase family 2 protein [Olivibacter]|jgi:glycosyltransferase involved in cell wall biosynthesis|uniref:Glycosyltransferase family 2 protein n=1 Tax=Olivibacter oleidegradans TaxID=760123 RepID=A0ABV6HSD6_9SPHI|nr:MULTISPECIES: glycosyltransferase family 2 protein [Olivibacter]MDM8176214.1 glycosyltransferase family 2 protein [Olivibacter sp. 47]